MDEDDAKKKKQYSVVGKVEIGADEFRDLIETNDELKTKVRDAENEASEVRSKLWHAEQEAEKTGKRVDLFNKFVNSTPAMKAAFDAFAAAEVIKAQNSQQ